MHLLKSTLKEICNENKNDQSKKPVTIKTNEVQVKKKAFIAIPPPPQTYVQLKKDWAYLQNDSKLLFQYLKVSIQIKSAFCIYVKLL